MSASDRSGASRGATPQALERVRDIRRVTHERVARELERERSARYAQGECLVAGIWVPEALAGPLRRARARRQLAAFLELVVFAVLVLLLIASMWRLFGFLFLPQVVRFIG